MSLINLLLRTYVPDAIMLWWDGAFLALIFLEAYFLFNAHEGPLKKHEYVVTSKSDIFYICKCIHCEHIIHLPPHLLQRMPHAMAMCEYGVKPTFKERFQIMFDCFLEEKAEPVKENEL
jgi:hypothetical protein